MTAMTQKDSQRFEKNVQKGQEPGATGVSPLPMLRTIKDSVFTDLFSDKKYALELFQSLHPEAASACEDDVEIVTIQNIMTSSLHNDLGFIVGNRVLILVEAQSTWSPNITLRALLYTAETIKNYIHRSRLDIYGPKPIEIPIPELYVVYTGSKRDVPTDLTLSDALFGGARSGVDSFVRVLCEPDSSIAGQYIDFARTLDVCRAERGSTEQTVREVIDDCIERGVLADYLRGREKEVVSIMMTLYNEEEVMRNYIASERREAEEEGIAQGIARGSAQGEVRGAVQTYRELGVSRMDAASKIAARFGMGEAQAQEMVEQYW